MLIPSPRHTPADLAHWAALETYDQALWTPQLRQKLIDACETIKTFADTRPGCVISTSWGKDSTLVAHLASIAAPHRPLVFVRALDLEPPETDHTRDAYLAAHPAQPYYEVPMVMRNPKRGELGHEHHALHGDHQDALAEAITGPYIGGTRAEESRARRALLNIHGDTTTRTCAPIIRLTTPEVFAALHRLHLPVHPSYAMTMGGHYDRTWLRVHHLLSTRTRQSGIHGDRNETWEDTYYPDIIRAAHQNRAHLWKDTHVVQGR